MNGRISRLGHWSIVALFSLSACSGGSGGGSVPQSTPTPAPQTADGCPSSGATPASLLAYRSAETARRAVQHATSSGYVPGEIAVTYDAHASAQETRRVAASLGAPQVASLAYSALGLRTVTYAVPENNVERAMNAFRAARGVTAVSRVSYASMQSISANDPYYQGFTGTTAPYYENAADPGQWDMHAINVAGGWSAYSSTPVVGAPIAIIDTGADLTHPELGGGRVIRTQCYVTYPAGSTQTRGAFVTDTDGHGTNVAGIADGDTNNGFAFSGVGYDAPLLIYRIFPTDPSGGCAVSPLPTQCETNSVDEASAINDAVAHGAKVINLSLGSSPPCSTNDPEYTAVENAIASNVVVVAAAGNGDPTTGLGLPQLDCPAADPGVIAVGASAINDSNPALPVEDVASYSNYVSPSNGSFLVAPGGDPCAGSTASSCGDPDHLHWIEHIYSTTAASALGPTCTGGTDFAGETGDCAILIAGTSQATPHVVGVVSLMLGLKPSLTPAQIATGLCSTADNINDSKQGCGRVDAAKAVAWAQSQP